jgi:hypothetical protein
MMNYAERMDRIPAMNYEVRGRTDGPIRHWKVKFSGPKGQVCSIPVVCHTPEEAVKFVMGTEMLVEHLEVVRESWKIVEVFEW